MYVLLTIQFPKHKHGVFSTVYKRQAKIPIFYNPVSTVQFFNLASTDQFLHPSTAVQLLQSSFDSPIFTSHFRQSRFDSPIFTIQSRTSISLHHTQGVSNHVISRLFISQSDCADVQAQTEQLKKMRTCKVSMA